MTDNNQLLLLDMSEDDTENIKDENAQEIIKEAIEQPSPPNPMSPSILAIIPWIFSGIIILLSIFTPIPGLVIISSLVMSGVASWIYIHRHWKNSDLLLHLSIVCSMPQKDSEEESENKIGF
jgi:hypothetical protein